AFSLSSRMMSVIAAARNPIRFPYTPIDRQPIFTSFGGAPPPTPRERSHVTVSGERWSSSPISLSLSPFSLYSIALFTRASMLFVLSPGARIGLPLLRLLANGATCYGRHTLPDTSRRTPLSDRFCSVEQRVSRIRFESGAVFAQLIKRKVPLAQLSKTSL